MIIEKIIELVALGLVTILFTYLIIYNVTIRTSAKKATAGVLQAELDNLALYAKIEELQKEANLSTQGNDGFLKFVSQSRDWAFQYIEKVQIAIKNFQDVFHPIAEQYHKDKTVYGVSPSIEKKDFDKLFEAYKKLIDELPDEGKKK